MYLKGKTFSLNLSGYSFRAYSRKGKTLKISKSFYSDKKTIKSFKLPRFTSKIVTFYKGKKIQDHTFGKVSKKPRFLGVSRTRDIISKSKPKSKKEKSELMTLSEWFSFLGIEWGNIGSGQLPQKPYVKDFVFVWDLNDFRKQYDYWKIWFAIKGVGSSEKALKNKKDFKTEVQEGKEYWNLAFGVVSGFGGKKFSGSFFQREARRVHVADLVEKTRVSHNAKYVSGKVFTQWVETYTFLGVEGFNEKDK